MRACVCVRARARSPPVAAGPQLVSRSLTTHTPEGELAATLSAIQGRFPSVTIGSYPQWATGNSTGSRERAVARTFARLTVDGRDADKVEEAVAAIEREIGAERE